MNIRPARFISRTRKRFRKFQGKAAVSLLSAGLVLALGKTCVANPSGATVRNGEVHIVPGVQTQIQQLTDRAIVDWNSFSINLNESVRFIQPGQLSVILNRVTGGDASQILGKLEANGNVFLINPNGILFGPNSEINVGGFVASTLAISDQDFLSGNYRFQLENSEELGAIVNQGRITVTDGGYAVLTGPSVINEGTIVARGGKVVLAAGEKATLNLDGRDLVHFAIDGDIGSGTVLLAPGVMSEAVATTLGVSPARQANQLIRAEDGSVRLASGTLVQSGAVSADGRENLDAGSILLDSADLTVLTNGSISTASGQGQNSRGGEVLVLSAMDGNATTRGFTDLQSGARLAATGGDTGDGGFIEVSGDSLNLHGEFDLSASDGMAGAFLLDPVVVTIVDGDNAPTGVPPTINLTANTIIGDEWFDANMGGVAAFTLQSSGDIIFDLAIPGNNPNFDNLIDFQGTDLTLIAGSDGGTGGPGVIDFGDDGTIFTDLDSLTLQTPGQVLLGNSVVNVNGAVNIDADGLVDFQSVDLELFGGNDLTVHSDTAVDFGSSQINSVANNNTGALLVTSMGTIDLGTSIIELDDQSFAIAAEFRAVGDIDFDDATINILHDFGTPAINIVSTGGTIDFGTADILFDQGFGAAPTVLVSAGNQILSGAGDNLATSQTTLDFDGFTTFTAANGVSLLDVDMSRGDLDSLTIDAGSGDLNLGESTIQVAGNMDFDATGDFLATDLILEATNTGDIDIDVGGQALLPNFMLNPASSNGTTGFFSLDAGGNIELGTSQLKVNTQSQPTVFRLSSGQDLLLQDSAIDIEHDFVTPLVDLLAVGNVDLGRSTIDLNQNFGGSPTVTIRATNGSITSQAADNTAAFANRFTLEGLVTMTAGGGVSIPDADMGAVAMNSLTIIAGSGDLNLGESTIQVAGNMDFDATGDFLATDLILEATNTGDIDIDVGGQALLPNIMLNPASSNGTTGFFSLDAGGNIELGTSQLKVNTQSQPTVFRLSSGQDLLLQDSAIDIEHDFVTPLVDLLAVGNVDLGRSTIDLNQNFGGSPTVTIRATNGSITSQAADNTAAFANRFTLEGLVTMTAGGGVSIPDADMGAVAMNSLTIVAGSGDLNLGESTIQVAGNMDFDATGDFLATDLILEATNTGDIDIDVGGQALLPNIMLNPASSNGTTGFFSLDAGGNIELGTSQLKVNTQSQPTVFRLSSGQDLLLQDSAIDIEHDFVTPLVDLLAVGNVDLGRSTIDLNQNFGGSPTVTIRATNGSITSQAADNTAAFANRFTLEGLVTMTAGGGVSIPDADMVIGSADPLVINSNGGDLDLGESRVRTNADVDLNVTGNFLSTNLILDAMGGDITIDTTGDLALGDGQFNQLLGGGSTGAVLLNSGGAVSAGDAAIFVNASSLVDVFTISGVGPVTLANLDADISGTFSNPSVELSSQSNLSLGSSQLDLIRFFGGPGSTSIIAEGDLDLGSAVVSVPDVIFLSSNSSITATSAQFTAPDFEVYGSTSLTPDPTVPIAGDVRLDLDSGGNIDLSVNATGNIEVNHTGGGALVTERIGEEGLGSAGSAASLRSTTGNITVVSDGTVRLGKGSGDTGDFALIQADGADSSASVTANTIVDTNQGNLIQDITAGALVSVVGATGNDAIEVTASGVSVDLSASPGAQSRVNIVGDSDFLQVKGFDSDIEVTELTGGNQLTVKQPSGQSVLSVEALGIEGVHYVDSVGVSLGSIEVGAGETLAVEVLNGGDISDGRTTGINVNLLGDLILLAGGDIGTSSQTVLVPGGRVAVQAGGEIHLETDGTALQIVDLELTDPLGAVQASASGLTGGADVTVRMSSAAQSLLTQEESIISTNGGVAIDINSGDLVQIQPATGPGPVVSGDEVVLKVAGDAGVIDGTNPITEIAIQADSLVLDVTGDAAIHQVSGDLTIADQATVGGQNFSAGIGGEDLRIRVSTGDLTIDSDITVSGEAALVTGSNLNLPAQLLPGSIVLNSNVSAGQSLVVLSNGDIAWQSGTLTAPQLGLGANGTIGSSGSPVQIQTNQLSRNPLAADVLDPDGFVDVASVTAAGVTVNQGLPVPEPEPNPPTNEPGGGVDGEIVVEVVLFPTDQEIDGSVFAQNNVFTVEDFLDGIFESPLSALLETDPTEMPLGWYNDDDFLQRKFRR